MSDLLEDFFLSHSLPPCQPALLTSRSLLLPFPRLWRLRCNFGYRFFYLHKSWWVFYALLPVCSCGSLSSSSMPALSCFDLLRGREIAAFTRFVDSLSPPIIPPRQAMWRRSSRSFRPETSTFSAVTPSLHI